MGLAIEGDEGALDPVAEEESAVHVRTDALSGRVVDGWLLESRGASRVDESGYALVPDGGDYVMFTWILEGCVIVRRVPTAVIEHVLRARVRAASDAVGVSSFEAEFGCMMPSERA